MKEKEEEEEEKEEEEEEEEEEEKEEVDSAFSSRCSLSANSSSLFVSSRECFMIKRPTSSDRRETRSLAFVSLISFINGHSLAAELPAVAEDARSLAEPP